jgi:predicted DNA-binding transcriptional regulator AlpA
VKDLIDIDEVCEIAKISRTTVYRRVRIGKFPKPMKVRPDNGKVSKMVNRWERGEIMGWLLSGNDPNWSKKENAPCPATDAIFEEGKPLKLDDVARQNEGAIDIYDYEPVEEPSKTKRYIAQAIVGALLVGIAVMIFGG